MTPTPAVRPGVAHVPLASSGRWRLGAFCATALLLLLPVLVAGRHVEAPARADELARLQRALAPAAGSDLDGEVARHFYRACAGGVADLPDDPAARQQLVVRARVGQLVALLGIVLLLYLVVLLARGRLQALLACACLAGVPAVGAGGHVLRPETPAALFAALGVLLLQCVAHEPPRARSATPRGHALSQAGLVLCAVAAVGLAVAALPTSGAILLVPGLVLSVATLQLVLRAARVVRRGGWVALPVRALNRRLLPWTAMALLAPAGALWLLSAMVRGPVEILAGTSDGGGWLPDSPWFAAPWLGLVGIGGIAMVLRVGGHLRRTGRIAPDLVLLVACGAVFAGSLGAPPGTDRLPLAVATGALLAEGAFLVLLVLHRLLARRRPDRVSPA